MLATDNKTDNRNEILAEITKHELAIFELRKSLASPIKTLFRFRCSPEQFVWVYADTREIAEGRLRERMNNTYGSNWKVTSKVVDVFNSVDHAAANSSGNLFRSLVESEARELLTDWQTDQRGRESKPTLKHLPKSQFERDAEFFDKALRQRDAKYFPAKSQK